MSREQTLERLKAAIDFDKPKAPIIEKIEEVIKETEPIAEPSIIEEVKPVETITEPLVDKPIEKEELSLFGELGKNTEEDFTPNQEKTTSKAEDILMNISDSDISEEEVNPEEDTPQFRKEMANIQAVGWVEFGDLIMCILCMWISGDWSKEAQEKKYALTTGRKKVLVISIMRILIAKKKKPNPTGAIIGVAVASFLPMIILAVMAGISKRREKEEAKKAALIPQRPVQVQYIQPTQAQPLPAQAQHFAKPIGMKAPMIKPVTGAKKGKQGRHKKFCNYYINGNCNCK